MSATTPGPSELSLIRALGALDRRPNPAAGAGAPQLFDLHAEYASADDFDLFYGEPLSRSEVATYDRYPGRRVTWLGERGRMLKVLPGYVSPRPDNIFDPQKLGAVAAAVREGRRIVTPAPYAHVMLIDADLVAHMRRQRRHGRLWEDGVARAFTSGDPAIDLYLEDPERAAEEEGVEGAGLARWRAKMARRVAVAEKAKRGDFGRYWARVRDGNHRLFGALMGGEPYGWVKVKLDPGERLPDGVLK